MSAMGMTVGCAAAASVVSLLAGCAKSDAPLATNGATQVVASNDNSDATPTHRAETTSNARRLCESALPGTDLIGWAAATVAQFRAYHYGGPTPTVPLAQVFPELPGNAGGAWCATVDGTSSTHWWAVVAGRPAASLITINGPGEGVHRGPLSGPPQIP